MIKKWICKILGHKHYLPMYNPRTGMTTYTWHNRCLRCGKSNQENKMTNESIEVSITKSDHILLLKLFVQKKLSSASQEVFNIVHDHKSIDEAVVEAVRNEAIIMVLEDNIKNTKKLKKKRKTK